MMLKVAETLSAGGVTHEGGIPRTGVIRRHAQWTLANTRVVGNFNSNCIRTTPPLHGIKKRPLSSRISLLDSSVNTHIQISSGTDNPKCSLRAHNGFNC